MVADLGWEVEEGEAVGWLQHEDAAAFVWTGGDDELHMQISRRHGIS